MKNKIPKAEREHIEPLSYNVRQGSRLTNMSPNEFLNLLQAGEIPARRHGRRWHVTKEAIMGWLQKYDNQGVR